MARPLKIDGTSGVQEMSDAELDGICYLLRVAYANQLNSGGTGSINVGGTGTSIGSATDTSATQQTASQGRDYVGGSDYPAAPGTGYETDATFNYKQVKTGIPGFPSNATLDSSGFLIIDGTSGLRVVNTEAQIYAEIIAQTLTDMKTGDEVGTYRVATGSPGTGWVDKGTFFTDTTYSAGSTTWKYFLKTSGTASTVTLPMMLSGTDITEATGTFDQSHAMIQNVLLPCLTRRINSGDLVYNVNTSGSAINRGSFTNTYQAGSATSNSFSNPTYYTTSTPSGGTSVVATYTLSLA